MRMIVLALVAAGLGGCAAIEPVPKLDRRLQQVAALLVGDFQSQKGLGPKTAEPVYVSIRAIEPPPGRNFALYQEIRAGSDQGAISRQRLFLFDETQGRAVNRLDAYSFADPKAAEGLRSDPSMVRSGALAFTPALAGEGCQMTVKMLGPDRFAATINKERCTIVGARGDSRQIEARVIISTFGLESLERGFDSTGTLVFGNAAGDAYVWPRIGRADGKPDEMTSRWKPKF